ncbi:MAG: HAD-IIA family hydrolase [Eubacteriales bacterium]|nr:HAD-IIA family hydrolase [Eubacteriales bacterium]
MISLRELKCFILDMDGTIYLGNRVIDGAHELLSLLDGKKIPYYFFTNNSSKSPAKYTGKLERLGFGRFATDRIITSGDVTAGYITRTFGTHAKAYVIGTESLIEQFTLAGITCTDTDTPDCVVAGFDTTFCYDKAQRAVDLLREGVPFLATNVDAVCPLEGGMVIPDCASICAMLTHASGITPKFLGKPFPETAAYIQNATKTPPCKIAVVGDRLHTDMRLALDNDMCAVGVLSGEMTRRDIESSDIRLHYLFDSVRDLYEELKKS